MHSRISFAAAVLRRFDGVAAAYRIQLLILLIIM
jgi:hypothetical protein